ncbi:MAG: hypothetical protein DRP28_04910 [Thermodesulfobacteriota bacterium]|nr:MAG: hypothetical protein DRP28_04910 [Thermodesulfobacteriota bacterium]
MIILQKVLNMILLKMPQACPRQTGIQHTQAGKESKAMQYGVFSSAIACIMMIIFHVGDSHG